MTSPIPSLCSGLDTNCVAAGGIETYLKQKSETPPPSTYSTLAPKQLAQLEQRSYSTSKSNFLQGLEKKGNYLQGVVDGLNPLTPVGDLLADALKVERPSDYWEGRVDGSKAGLFLDAFVMSGGVKLATEGIQCAQTAGPPQQRILCTTGSGVGEIVTAAGVGLAAIHTTGLKKAEDQYLESRRKENGGNETPKNSKPEISKEESRKINPSKSESPVWKNLKPFKNGVKTNGLSGKEKRYYDWDYEKNEIEVYGLDKQHRGVIDPVSGKQIKEAIPGRNIKHKI